MPAFQKGERVELVVDQPIYWPFPPGRVVVAGSSGTAEGFTDDGLCAVRFATAFVWVAEDNLRALPLTVEPSS